ncbi:3-hydroxyacyl-CoA dehydrogenase [Lutimaribacter pacificus]|uniref:3-hydroxyacyl-CoA dehydrogenase n=1 Tax=Lutimaribacter pacificus TaxID=391948 RepID=A0A1H0AWY7_9RHOB|nr:3-hydroxyacyl-CoA dehydrogenase [Lutimaribacter pacificus]SHJ63582.1 3-hydroxyacyl-CoA dehydrogenase [Lutimaribacter pacificus]
MDSGRDPREVRLAQAGDMVRIARQGDIAILSLDNPPANLLGAPLRAALMAALDAVAGDDGLRGAVLTGAGGNFSNGLDLRELEAPLAAPEPRDLANRIEMLGKPVVAALTGRASGAGLELALAATARVAHPATRIMLGDLGLGLPPGAGGTQRLPRIVGAGPALDLVLTARPVPASALPALFDDTDAADPLAAAVALARDLADAPRPPTSERREGFADPAAYQAEIARRRDEAATSPLPAVRDVVAAVEAALLLPFEAGLALEAQVFADALASSRSRAQRHVVRAELRAANMPETRPRAARHIGRVGIVGGGPTACGIARVCLAAGLPVIQFERDDAALAKAQKRLQEPAPGVTGLDGWQGTTALPDLAGADLIVEAVADLLRTKEQVFAALSDIAGDETILATQSGLLPIDPIAAATARPEQVLGLHFHAPVGPARLVEVIPGSRTDPQAVASVAALVRGTLGRIAVRSGTGGGTLPERITAAARDAGIAMLVPGVPIGRIDGVMAQWGLPQGIFRQIDMIGCDVVLARGRLLARGTGFPTAHLDALARLVEAGRTGRAAGLGFYRWDEKGHAHTDDALGEVLFGGGFDRMSMPGDEIRLRVIAAMANEGARMLRADMALRPSDIDVACVLGTQFPRWRGGPMKAADLTGLFEIQRALKRLAVDWPELYGADPGFAALVRNGESFDALNGVGKDRRSIPG